MKTAPFFAAIAIFLGAAPLLPVSAATLVLAGTTRQDVQATVGVNLTTLGGLDWALFSATNTPPAGTYLPTIDKATGGTIISGISAIGGTTVRGSASTQTTELYTFTDGSSPTSATNAPEAGLMFNLSTGTSGVNTGISLSITGDPSTERLVTLYLGGFNATGRLTLTLNGATTIVDNTQTYTDAPKAITMFAVRFQPNSASDTLNVSWVTTAVTDAANGHVGIQAVTVSAVPEPNVAVLSLMSGGALLGLWRRNRR